MDCPELDCGSFIDRLIQLHRRWHGFCHKFAGFYFGLVQNPAVYAGRLFSLIKSAGCFGSGYVFGGPSYPILSQQQFISESVYNNSGWLIVLFF